MKRRLRLSSHEESRNFKKAGLFIVLTIGLLSLLFFFGIPLMARFATFIAEFGKSDDPITKDDKIPPAPPRIEDLPEATNKFSLDLKGATETGATVIIDFNGQVEEVLAGADGNFSKKVNLLDGDNTLTLTARDPAGNISQPTDTYKIVYDGIKPKLSVGSPSDGAEFFGSGQRQVTIQGTSEFGVNLLINDRLVSIGEEGNFSFTTSLSEGENIFNVKATDKAGNESESTLTLQFNP